MTENRSPTTKPRLALITGAAAGLGLATARGLAEAGCDVILSDRDVPGGQRACEQLNQQFPQQRIEFAELDLADLDKIAAFARQFLHAGQPLDLLINNAGLFPPFRRATTTQGSELGFGVSFYGHFALSAQLLPLLLASEAARIITVSSIAHSAGRIEPDDPLLERDYDANRAYSACKLASLIFARELDAQARAAGVALKSIAAHPGVARTQIGQHRNNPARSMRQHAIGWATRFAMRFLGQDAELGALPMIYAALAPEVPGGSFIGPDGFGQFKGQACQVKPNARALSRHDSQAIWRMAESYSGQRFSWPVAQDESA